MHRDIQWVPVSSYKKGPQVTDESAAAAVCVLTASRGGDICGKREGEGGTIGGHGGYGGSYKTQGVVLEFFIFCFWPLFPLVSMYFLSICALVS